MSEATTRWSSPRFERTTRPGLRAIAKCTRMRHAGYIHHRFIKRDLAILDDPQVGYMKSRICSTLRSLDPVRGLVHKTAEKLLEPAGDPIDVEVCVGISQSGRT